MKCFLCFFLLCVFPLVQAQEGLLKELLASQKRTEEKLQNLLKESQEMKELLHHLTKENQALKDEVAFLRESLQGFKAEDPAPLEETFPPLDELEEIEEIDMFEMKEPPSGPEATYRGKMAQFPMQHPMIYRKQEYFDVHDEKGSMTHQIILVIPKTLGTPESSEEVEVTGTVEKIDLGGEVGKNTYQGTILHVQSWSYVNKKEEEPQPQADWFKVQGQMSQRIAQHPVMDDRQEYFDVFENGTMVNQMIVVFPKKSKRPPRDRQVILWGDSKGIDLGGKTGKNSYKGIILYVKKWEYCD
jgi:regulator of replication initiation timing